MKPNKKENLKGGVEVTLQLIPKKVSKRKSGLESQIKVLQKKSESDPPKTRDGYFKIHSLKPNKNEGEVEVTLQPIPKKVSKKKSVLVSQIKVLQRKKRRSRGKVVEYIYYQYDSDSSYFSKETSESSEYPVVKACDPQVYNCKNRAELEKKRKI